MNTDQYKLPAAVAALISATGAWFFYMLQLYAASSFMALIFVISLWSLICFTVRNRFGEIAMSTYWIGLIVLLVLIFSSSAIFAHTVEFEPIEGGGFFPWWIFLPFLFR